MSTTIGIFLEALDVLFFRDGRPFGAALHGTSGLPAPQTLTGAVRTALLEKAGCDFEKMRPHPDFAQAVVASCPPEFHGIGTVAVRGPWLARRREKHSADVDVLVPAPATLHVRKTEKDETLYRLAPLPPSTRLPGWTPEQPGLRPLWLRKHIATEPAEGYLTTRGLTVFLNGQDVPAGELVKRESLYAFDHRTGIGIDPDRLSAQESLIYGASFLALADGVGLYGEVVVPDERLRPLVEHLTIFPFGGEGRRVRVEIRPQPFGWPRVSGPGKPLLLLTTPGLFKQRWRPDALPAPSLVAAAVPGAIAVSGWDLARRGPKPTRFAAAPGSVYFLDGTPDSLPPDSLSDNPDDRQQGWGCYLKGVWTDA